jgi:hypothetical protein
MKVTYDNCKVWIVMAMYADKGVQRIAKTEEEAKKMVEQMNKAEGVVMAGYKACELEWNKRRSAYSVK